MAEYPLKRKPEIVEAERKQKESGDDMKNKKSIKVTELNVEERMLIEKNKEKFKVLEEI